MPIRVPQLGTQEVRAYLMLLYVENSDLPQPVKETIRSRIGEQLRQTWQGKRVDRAFVQTLHDELPAELLGQLETAERLAPLMTKASGIVGNPRLIKRFLNALSIRMTIARAQGVAVDEAALAKMLLFERLGNAEAYKALLAAVTGSESGKPEFLATWEEKALKDSSLELDSPWDGDFVREWLTLPPRLADLDLRGVLYVSREYAPLITPEDSLSSTSIDLLSALLEHPDMAASLKDRLKKVPKPEADIIMGKLLDKAGQEQEWGVPPILDALIAFCEADPSQGKRLATFLANRPASQIQPSIVPKIRDMAWSQEVFKNWGALGVTTPVMRAINKV